MKLKTYTSYARASRTATVEAVFIDNSDIPLFAHRADLIPHGAPLTERSFTWLNDQYRTFQLFKLASGAIGFLMTDTINGRRAVEVDVCTDVFTTEARARAYFDNLCTSYIADECKRWWTEIVHETCTL